MVGKGVSGAIFFTPPPAMLNAIVSFVVAAFASVIACRKLPAPESFVFVTVKVAAFAFAAAKTVVKISQRPMPSVLFFINLFVLDYRKMPVF